MDIACSTIEMGYLLKKVSLLPLKTSTEILHGVCGLTLELMISKICRGYRIAELLRDIEPFFSKLSY